ncbi:hypothetical protein DD237_006630 [Peronospora effusa]|uniref:Amidohydrolase 3 domain-containing protein n=1 Tax=Peronospora effusa TaxID=542832 RepID=A0A3R7W2D7_9STRA|nr:hypothetical protein DD237_006630 [Peronospora effusa]
MKVFVNGKIWQWAGDNFVANGPFAEWMTVSDDGRFIDVGIGKYSHSDDVEDLHGALVLPGLHDSHIHVSMMGESAEWLDLSGCNSYEDFIERLRRYNAHYSEKSWIVGFGWTQDELSSTAKYPSRYDIDAVIPDRPVLLHRACWHIAVVNTKALEIAGVEVTAKNHDVKHGTIDVDEKGVTDVRVKYYKNAVKKCVSSGLTAVHTNDEEAWFVYSKLQEEEGLPVRVYLTPSIHELGKTTIPKAGDCDGLISCHRIKIFSDGSLGAETAALRVPYKGTDNRGILMNSDEELVTKISKANNAGYRVEIHAIGECCWKDQEDVLMVLLI